MMRLIRTVEELTQVLAGSRPAFVPTMGALHEGHLALIRHASQLDLAGPVLVSIFVNPTQFGPDEDYARYPRSLNADVQAAASAGADLVFAPEVETVYPETTDRGFSGALPAVATQPGLENAHRPGHFAGVCQVVARLFDLIQPSLAVFGEKDYQQLLVIKAMVQQEAQRWPGLKIIGHPTVREPDGLAMSSRNAYLNPMQRIQARAVSQALISAKPERSPREAEAMMLQMLQAHSLLVDYAVVRDSATLMPIEALDRPIRALIAVRIEGIRLIDNMPLP